MKVYGMLDISEGEKVDKFHVRVLDKDIVQVEDNLYLILKENELSRLKRQNYSIFLTLVASYDSNIGLVVGSFRLDLRDYFNDVSNYDISKEEIISSLADIWENYTGFIGGNYDVFESELSSIDTLIDFLYDIGSGGTMGRQFIEFVGEYDKEKANYLYEIRDN